MGHSFPIYYVEVNQSPGITEIDHEIMCYQKLLTVIYQTQCNNCSTMYLQYYCRYIVLHVAADLEPIC